MAAQETANKSRKNSKERRARQKTDGRKSEEKGRQESATPAQSEGGSFIERARRYLQSVLSESKRVTWPTKAELVAGTVVTLFTLLMFASYLGLMDYVFGQMLK